MNIGSSGSATQSIPSTSEQAEAASKDITRGNLDQAKAKHQVKVGIVSRDRFSQVFSMPGILEHTASYLDYTSCEAELGELTTAVRSHSVFMDRTRGRAIKWEEAGITDADLRGAVRANTKVLAQSLNGKLKFGEKVEELTKDLEKAMELSKKEEIPLINALYETSPFLCEILLHPDQSGSNSDLISLLEDFSVKRWFKFTSDPLPKRLEEALVYASENPKCAAILKEELDIRHGHYTSEDVKTPTASRSQRDMILEMRPEVLSKKEIMLEALEEIDRESGRDEVFRYLNIIMQSDCSDDLEAVAYACGKLKGPESLAILQALSVYNDEYVLSEVAMACGEIGTDEAFQVLSNITMAAAERCLISSVIEAFGKFKTVEAVNALLLFEANIGGDAFNPGIDSIYHQEIARAYSNIATPRALVELKRLSTNEDPRVRYEVAKGCTNFEGPVALEILKTFENDLDQEVCEGVAEACSKLQTKEAFDILWKLTNDRADFDSYLVTDAIRSYLI